MEFILNANITKLNAKDTLESIEITYNTKEIKTLYINGLFIAIGKVPETNNFINVVDCDEEGYIKSQENCHTKTKGIFVAGDIREKQLRQLVTATSDGAIAATEAIKYINGEY